MFGSTKHSLSVLSRVKVGQHLPSTAFGEGPGRQGAWIHLGSLPASRQLLSGPWPPLLLLEQAQAKSNLQLASLAVGLDLPTWSKRLFPAA